MLLDIRHETLYRYAVPASYSLQYMRLWPRADGGQRVLHWRIDAPGRRWPDPMPMAMPSSSPR